MTAEQQTYCYASTRLRVYQAFIAVSGCALVGGIASAAIPGAVRYVLIACTVFTSAWAAHRAFRLELCVSTTYVSIKNFWRSYEIKWEDISDVGVGLKALGFVPQSAFAFRTSDQEARAQATPSRAKDRLDALRVMTELAPSGVRFNLPKT